MGRVLLDSGLLFVRPTFVLQFEVEMIFAAAHDIYVGTMIPKTFENQNVRKVGKKNRNYNPPKSKQFHHLSVRIISSCLL